MNNDPFTTPRQKKSFKNTITQNTLFFIFISGFPVSNLLNNSDIHLGKTEKMLACQVNSLFVFLFSNQLSM